MWTILKEITENRGKKSIVGKYFDTGQVLDKK